MKKIMTLILALLLFTCFAACEAGERETEKGQVLSVTVEYDVEQIHRSVKIDLEDRTKTVTDYLADSREETSDTFSETEALLRYLEETVIPDMEGKSGTSSEERVAWRIRIVTDAGNLVAYGTGEAAFPAYWEDLLALLQEG